MTTTKTNLLSSITITPKEDIKLRKVLTELHLFDYIKLFELERIDYKILQKLLTDKQASIISKCKLLKNNIGMVLGDCVTLCDHFIDSSSSPSSLIVDNNINNKNSFINNYNKKITVKIDKNDTLDESLNSEVDIALNPSNLIQFHSILSHILNLLNIERFKRQKLKKYDDAIILLNIIDKIKPKINTKLIEYLQKIILRCENQLKIYKKLEERACCNLNYVEAKQIKFQYDCINVKLDKLSNIISNSLTLNFSCENLNESKVFECILNTTTNTNGQSLSSLLFDANLPVDLINNISSSWCPNVKKIIGRKRNISSILGSSNENVDALEYYDFSDYDLEGSDLSGLNLSEVKLTGTNLVKTNFKNAKLSEVEFNNLTNMIEVEFSNVDFSGRDFSGLKFIKCNFNSTNLSFVKFIGCDLSGSTFVNANINSINLKNAILINTDFSNHDFSSFNFSNYNLSGVQFIGCNLSNVDLSQCQLNNTNFSKSLLVNTNFGKQLDMIECDFSNTDLSSFDFSKRNLSKSKFIRTNLMNANFSSCDLTSVDFSSANLIKANLLYTKCVYPKLDNANFGKVKIVKENTYIHKHIIERVICNDKIAVFGDEKGSVLCFDYDENQVECKFTKKWERKEHSNCITSLIFSFDLQFVLSGSADKSINMYKIETGEFIKKFSGHKFTVYGLISLSSSYLVSVSYDMLMKLWDIDDSKEVISIDMEIECYCIGYKSNKSVIATGHRYGIIKLWSISQEQVINEKQNLMLSLYKSRIKTPYVIIEYFGDFLQHVKYRYVNSEDKSISNSSPYQIKMIKQWQQQHQNDIKSICYSSNDELLAAASYQTIVLYDSKTIDYQVLRIINADYSYVNSISFSSNNLFLLSSSNHKSIKIWSIGNGECIGTNNDHTDSVGSVVYTSSGNSVISGSNDKTLMLSKLIWEY
jgi:uncharacterized protein YjbI with pentapeptide repeats